MGAFDEIDVETTVIEQIDSLEINAPLVLPGVGAFGDAMQKLSIGDTIHYLSEAYKKGHPIMGICLGMQIMFERSEEDFDIEGLNFLPGHVRNLNRDMKKFCQPSNIGYARLHTCKIQDIGQYSKFDGKKFYFMHSFGLIDDKLVTQQKLYVKLMAKKYWLCSATKFSWNPIPSRVSGETGLKLLGLLLTNLISKCYCVF